MRTTLGRRRTMADADLNSSNDRDSVLPSRNASRAWIVTHSSNPVSDPFRCGKWLVHVDADHVDAAWQTIALATADDKLGPASKVSTFGFTRPGTPHVICVYTRDYIDLDDLTRVLGVLRSLGFNQRLSYKEDAATHASKYGRGAALYVSQAGAHDFERRRDPIESDGFDFFV